VYKGWAYAIRQITSMKMLKAILVELNRLGSHIVYNTLSKRATLYNGYPAAVSPISAEELLTLFGKAWITRYESLDGEHCYRITESGRLVIC
jgi:hypothetical protein